MKKAGKRIGAAALCMAMAISMLGGCGKDGTEDNNDAGNAVGDTAAAAGDATNADGDWNGEVTKIIMTFPTPGVEPADLALVEDALNEISVKKAGVEVEFKPVSIFDISAQCPMWIGAGEQIDLMCVAFTGLQVYIDQGMINPLDEWLATDGAYLQELAKEQPVYDTTGKDGVYGIMTLPSYLGNAGGYLIAVEDLEAAGLSYKDGDMVTLDDMDRIFAAIKEAKPDVYPCGVIGSTNRGTMTFECDFLGATAASGALIGLDSTEVVNLYATDEYKSYLEHVRSWYENGYILKDAATTDISLSELSRNGSLSGYFSEGNAALRNALELNTGREYIHLMFNEPYIPAVSAAANSYWTVPVTAKEPAAAVRFLNLMFEDPLVANTLVWGVEGKHYTLLDEEEGIIGYPDGVTQENSGYAYGLGLYGQQIDNYMMGQSTKEEDVAWNEKALSRRTKGYGFCYDPSAMTNQITAVTAVISEYVPALETGSADLEATYAEFLEKLEANGINEIIADKQAQFDAWLAGQ